MTKDQALKRAQEDADKMGEPMIVGELYGRSGRWAVVRASWDKANLAMYAFGRVTIYPHGKAPKADPKAIKPHWSGR